MHLLAIAVAVVAWLGFAIGLHPLMLPDEGRYVGVAWEMARSGNWIVPTEDGLPFFHKPPLFYWLVALSIKTWGSTPAAARLTSVCAAGLGVMLLHVVLRRRVGAPLANATVLVLVTMPLFFGAAQYANLDILVAACIALAIVFGADAAIASRRHEPAQRSILIAWTFAALGVLAKGLIGLVLPGLVLAIWLVAGGQPRTILRLLWWPALALFAAVSAPWFIAVQSRYPDFASYFFIHHHFERFAGSGFNNVQPWWFFLAALPLLTTPWSLWLVRARSGRVDPDPERRSLRRLMWTWLGVVVLFFSIPRSKPVGYILPALFPLAFLVAEPVLAAWRTSRLQRLVVASALLATSVCVGGVAWLATRYDRDHASIASTLRRLRAPGDAVVFVGDYFFDVPFLADLREPVPVVADWRPERIAEHDNWRRELAEAATFAPAKATALLSGSLASMRCEDRPRWVLVGVADEAPLLSLPGATRIAQSRQVALWKVAGETCRMASQEMRADPGAGGAGTAGARMLGVGHPQ
ncbi:MAG TPA: glycosyltransferase family 39 protein [Caldimonas sp.]|nr:glycosyltransferase family 39 protein [Caldimonas sp.]